MIESSSVEGIGYGFREGICYDLHGLDAVVNATFRTIQGHKELRLYIWDKIRSILMVL